MKPPAALEALARRVLGWPAVGMARRILERYESAGGGLLAGGLTYSALFALLPSLLLITAVLGFAVDDPERRRAIVEGIGETLPPLRGFLDASLRQITEGAASAGTIGLIGLAWGASRFYGSLDDAFARIFASPVKRGFVSQTLRGVLSVVLLITVFLAALVLTGIASYLAEATSSRLGSDTKTFWQIVTPLMTLLVFVAGMAVLYRVLPSSRIPWRAVLLPSLVVGLALTILTQLFSYVAPRLIGSAALYGTYAAIFAAMVWLSAGFQLMLVGAAWIRERVGPPAPPFLDR